MGMNEKTVVYACLASAIALGSSQVQAVGETAYGFEAGGTGNYNSAVGCSALIFVTTPAGLNTVVNCDIQNQPIELAFKKLLGDMSYSLQRKDNGETLVGPTVLTGTGSGNGELCGAG